MRVFVDTNVLLDVLLSRKPFYEDAARIWTLAEKGRIQGLISVLSYANAFYVVRKTSGMDNARQTLRVLRGCFSPVPCDGQIVNQAIDATNQDFEDAVQYFSAQKARADCIVTRNLSHFRQSKLRILAPSEFLSQWQP